MEQAWEHDLSNSQERRSLDLQRHVRAEIMTVRSKKFAASVTGKGLGRNDAGTQV